MKNKIEGSPLIGYKKSDNSKVIDGEIVNVEANDYIESRVYLNYIGKDGAYSYKTSIKMKEGKYISALNKNTAKKQLIK